jgi:hypothetical protein
MMTPHRDDTALDALTTLRAIACRYRVDLVPLADLKEASSRHGRPLPDELRPPRVTANGSDAQECGRPTPAPDLPIPVRDPPLPAPDATPDDVVTPHRWGSTAGL